MDIAGLLGIFYPSGKPQCAFSYTAPRITQPGARIPAHDGVAAQRKKRSLFERAARAPVQRCARDVHGIVAAWR
jgi:hypothetical protein